MTHVHRADAEYNVEATRSRLTEFLRSAAVRGSRGGPAAATRDDGVGQVSSDIRSLAALAARADAQESRWAKESVARINEAIGDIAVATQATRPSEVSRLREGGGVRYEKTWVSPDILGVEVESASFPPGEERLVEFEVTSAGRPAGLYVEFGGKDVDLAGSTSVFLMEVAGPDGAGSWALPPARGSTRSLRRSIRSATSLVRRQCSRHPRQGFDSTRAKSARMSSSRFASWMMVASPVRQPACITWTLTTSDLRLASRFRLQTRPAS